MTAVERFPSSRNDTGRLHRRPLSFVKTAERPSRPLFFAALLA
jgi:hypothetical protein